MYGWLFVVVVTRTMVWMAWGSERAEGGGARGAAHEAEQQANNLARSSNPKQYRYPRTLGPSAQQLCC